MASGAAVWISVLESDGISISIYFFRFLFFFFPWHHEKRQEWEEEQIPALEFERTARREVSSLHP